MYQSLLFGWEEHIMSDTTVLIGGKTKITLTQKEYKAQGGEGIVYVKGKVAYKIYHDASKMIPEGKILELQKISTENVLAPREVLYNPKSKKAVGFTMPFVDKTEYLTKMFSRKFKTDNKVTPQMVVGIAAQMQKQLNDLHHEGIVVGDYNEMNFLVDSKFNIPYHIDVDSYQTKSFPCTAIMDSIRDRRLPFGKFDEMSDWFAWAIVTFQMYTGVHPYKGRHPDFKTTELDERMKKNISVFDPKVKIPKNCQDFSVIPSNQLQWYKDMFIKGERSVPPIAGSIGYIPGFTPIAITDTGSFTVDIINNYGDVILNVQFFDGYPYVTTANAIYRKTKEVVKFNKSQSNIKLINVMGGTPVIAMHQDGKVAFFDFDRNPLGSISCTSMMVSNGHLYTVSSNGQLIENYFETLGKVQHMTRVVDQLGSVYKMFEGVIIQDIFGKRHISIPYEHKKCANIEIHELEKYRIVDAKRVKNVMIVIGEKSGQYDRFVIFFDKTFKSYDARIDSDIAYHSVNFMVKQNGVVATIINDDTLELFMDNKKGTKELTGCPIDLDMSLYDGIDKVLFVDGNTLYSIKMG
jgi:hypothetical protein